MQETREVPARALPAIPEGGGRVIIDKQGGRDVITFTSLPPDVHLLTQRVEETAFGLMGMLVAIIILGPFARMFARRLERRPEVQATAQHTLALREQLLQLQQTMDAMSIEMERVGEAQRFHSKILLKQDASL